MNASISLLTPATAPEETPAAAPVSTSVVVGECDAANDEHGLASTAHGADNLASTDGRPVIRLQPGERLNATAMAMQELAKTGTYYGRSGSIVRISTDSRTGETAIKDINPAELLKALDEVAIWQRFGRRSSDWVTIDSPDHFAGFLLRAGVADMLDQVSGLARQPYLREDGELVSTPGYDMESGLYAVFSDADFPDGVSPSRPDAEAALRRLNALLDEFPFATDSDRAAALAAMLTAAVRPALAQAPMFHVKAHAPGTGKSYLCSLITAFATPHQPAPLSFPGSNDECDKVLLAELARSPAVIEFDNLTGDIVPFKKLCTVLTSEKVTGRVLRQSKILEVPTRTLILSSGNNVGPIADMTRRCLVINLDAKDELPAAREFTNPGLLDQVRANRASYVLDALTVVQAWLQSGEPTKTIRPLASFEQWSRWCRQALLWLGTADPADSIFDSMQNDPERETLGMLLAAWDAKVGDKPVMVRDLIEFSSGLDTAAQELREALLEVAGEREQVNRKKLGWWVKRHAGQVVAGKRIVKAPKTRNSECWRVVSLTSV